MPTGTSYDDANVAGRYALGAAANAEVDPSRRFIRDALTVVPRASNVLDVGCGTGLDLERYKAMGLSNLHGIDPTEEFLEKARALLGDQADVREGCFEVIPYEDGAFDVVVSRHALHYCKDVRASLREAARVLTPGGLLMVVVSHPLVDALETADGDGNITITLFGGTTPITFPKHTLPEYFCATFLFNFELVLVKEYLGTEQDRHTNGLPNALCFIARKKGG